MDPVLLAPGCLSPSGSSRQGCWMPTLGTQNGLLLAHFSMWFPSDDIVLASTYYVAGFTFKVAFYLQNPIYISILEMKRASSREVKEIAPVHTVIECQKYDCSAPPPGQSRALMPLHTILHTLLELFWDSSLSPSTRLWAPWGSGTMSVLVTAYPQYWIQSRHSVNIFWMNEQSWAELSLIKWFSAVFRTSPVSTINSHDLC